MVTEAELLRAAEILRTGGLVAFPTETVYGLGANALDPAAVARIYAAKGRPSTSPLIVHVASVQMARDLAAEWPATADVLSATFWPGPLTLVVKKTRAIPDSATAGLDTVGLRMPAHPVARALIELAGIPIAAPSANRFTELSPTTADHVRAGLGSAVDCILDGGPTDVGIESTVLSLVERPILLRPGMVSQTQIEALIGPVDVAGEATGAHRSPGMHLRHYSPRTKLLIGDPPKTGTGVYLYWRLEQPAAKLIRMPSDAPAYASVLYDLLHRMDEEGWDWVAVEPVPDEPAWAGIRDRLTRAAYAG